MRKVEVTFTADEVSPGEYRIHDDVRGGIVIYLDPGRIGVVVSEVPREYRFGQVYKVFSNTTFDKTGYGLWVVIRDRDNYLTTGYRFACPASGHVFSRDEWEAFTEERNVELVSEEYVRDSD